jgi:site-specific DNA-methyltransferase (adenine-specific)
MVANILGAGFELQDIVLWSYGSGFPKSLDVSKAIDKAANRAAPPGFAEWLRIERESKGMSAKELCERGKFYANVNHGGLVSNWESGLGVPNTDQFNLLCDLLDLPFERREEIEREILGWRKVSEGVAFSSEGATELPITAPATPEAQQWEGWSTALKPSHEPVSIFTKGGSLTFHAEPKRLYYCAKAPKKERNLGLAPDVTNTHPTVKPLKLMEQLCQLATPAGGTILDPFMGSGTTGIAALNMGYNFIGIDMGEEYFDIASCRLNSLFPKSEAQP